MRKIRNLIGMPVVFHRRRLGRLVQADLSSDLRRMKGIWVDCGLKGTRYIPSEQLEMIGEKAVLADSLGSRRRCKGGGILRRAISTDGSRLGAIVGAEVDELSFLVRSLELSGGFWDDLYHGRRRIAQFSAAPNGEVIIMDPTQEDEREDEI